MHRAGAALPDAAAEFRALDVEHIAQDPQQRHVVFDIDRMALAVDLDGMSHRYSGFNCCPKILHAYERFCRTRRVR
jgi:hypothetical protein